MSVYLNKNKKTVKQLTIKATHVRKWQETNEANYSHSFIELIHSQPLHFLFIFLSPSGFLLFKTKSQPQKKM